MKNTMTLQKNGAWGYAIFRGEIPKWLNETQGRWESGEPITLREKTVQELGLIDANFKKPDENSWPCVEITENQLLATSEGKERYEKHVETKRKKEEMQKAQEEKRKEIEKKKEIELQEKRSSALRQAQESGKNVMIRKLGSYDGDEEEPGKELGIVNVYEVATPSGEIITQENPTY